MLADLDASWWWSFAVCTALAVTLRHAWRTRSGKRWWLGPDLTYRHLLARCTCGGNGSELFSNERFRRVSTMNAEIKALASGCVITLWGKRGGLGALMPIDEAYWQDGGAIDDLAAACEGRGRTYRDPLDQNATWYDDLHLSTLEARRLLWGWSVAMARNVVRKPVRGRGPTGP